MSAPATDLASSTSSSGHTDGLGRRSLAFDRETGAIRERLYLRPELSAFEEPLRRRVQLLETFEDERFARPCTVQRDPVSGELTVMAEFIAGSRLSDLIETAQETSSVPGVDAALGFLLEALPALSSFHSVLSISHGLIDPTRMAVTPAGQVVLLDTAFGEVVERLALSPARLWTEFGLAVPQSSGRARLDAASDLRQVALGAIILVLGRRVRREELQGPLPSILAEVGDVAQIRGSAAFAAGLQEIVRRCLVPVGTPAQRTEDVLADVRKLVAREIGEDVCHRALIEFLEQMDAACAGPPEYAQRGRSFAAHGPNPEPTTVYVGGGLEPELLPLDAAGANATHDSPVGWGGEQIVLDPMTFCDPVAAASAAASFDAPEPALRSPTPAIVPAPDPVTPVDETVVASAPKDGEAATEAVAEATVDQPGSEPEAEVAAMDAPAEDPGGALAAESHRGSGRRRKRAQRSARERKDKLRSVSADREQATGQPARSSPWIVSPSKAAAFEPVNPTMQPASARPGVERPKGPVIESAIPMPVFPPVPVAPPSARNQDSAAAPHPPPVTVQVPAPVAGQPVPITPVTPVAPQATRTSPAPSKAPLRIKAEPPRGFKPPRTRETLSAQPYHPQGPLFGASEPARFPARLAAVLLLIVGVGVVVGRSYLPAREDSPGGIAAAPEAEPPVVVAPQPESGEIVVRSEPAGVRVLLDGKPVGETPLKLTSVATGRHVLTFASAAGEVTRTVRVAAGQTVDVDVPVFSGFLAVFAPIVLDVSVDGRSLGTTEQTRLMLPPGRHKVTLANRELGYRAVQTVAIEPGEVESVTIEPLGRVNLNAQPWAEVWLDGRKLGETPIADIQIPLGVREFVFKHPEHGERKTTAIVRGDQPTAVSIDFTRPSVD